jgi:superfamily II DNA or RNA helicase
MSTHSLSWNPFFPGTPRDAQTDILNTITTNWHYRTNAAIDAPTGVGKSLIVKTLIGWLAARIRCDGQHFIGGAVRSGLSRRQAGAFRS